MSKQIVQINFNYSVPTSDLTKAYDGVAEQFAQLPGLQWKLWLLNEGKKESGGIYVFEDETSAKKFLDGELFAMVLKHPALSNHTVKQFEVDEPHSRVTRAPLGPIPAR